MAVRITLLPPIKRGILSEDNSKCIAVRHTSVMANDEIDLRVQLDFHVWVAHEVFHATCDGSSSANAEGIE